MSNGDQCCALEICCLPAQRRARLGAAIAAATGATQEQAEKVLDWMDYEGLCFAPASMRDAMQTVANHARKEMHS